MRKIKIIDDSMPTFVVNQKYLAYIDKSKSSFKVCSLNGEIIDEYTKKGAFPYSLLYFEPENLVWAHIKDDQGLHHPVIFSDNQIQVKEKPYLFVNYLPDDHSRYERIIQEEQKIYQKRDFNKNLIWEYPTQNSALNFPTLNHSFFFAAKEELVTLDNHTGQELWRYSLPEGEFDYIYSRGKIAEGRIRKILGVYQQNIWLDISNGSVIGLDLETGQQIAQLFRPVFAEGFSEEKHAYFTNHLDTKHRGIFYHSVNIELDSETGIIFGFSSESYAEIDLTDPNYPFTFWDIKETLKDQEEENKPAFDSLEIGSWEQNKVYVFDSFSTSNRFGVFDRNTRTILWSEYFDGANEGWGAIKGLKHSNGYLYIQAKVDSSLHIYEITEDKEPS